MLGLVLVGRCGFTAPGRPFVLGLVFVGRGVDGSS